MQANDQAIGLKPIFSNGKDRLTLLLILALTIVRSLALFISPLELGVDEAQYWLWGQNLDFGYFTNRL